MIENKLVNIKIFFKIDTIHFAVMTMISLSSMRYGLKAGPLGCNLVEKDLLAKRPSRGARLIISKI